MKAEQQKFPSKRSLIATSIMLPSMSHRHTSDDASLLPQTEVACFEITVALSAADILHHEMALLGRPSLAAKVFCALCI